MVPIFNYAVSVQSRCWARVYLNDVPLYDEPQLGPDAQSGPVNQLLRKGENEVSVELLRTAPQPGIEHVDGAFAFRIYSVDNPDAPEGTPLAKTVVCDVRYPDIFHAAPEAHRRLPLFHRQTFRIEHDLPTPPFFDAPPASFECEGLSGQREAVERLFDCLARGDHDGLLDALTLKFEVMERAFPGQDRMRVGARMREWREELLRYEPRPDRPLNFGELHFASRRGGQVVHVTRFDRHRALEATCLHDPDRQILTDLTMTQHGGRWRVFL